MPPPKGITGLDTETTCSVRQRLLPLSVRLQYRSDIASARPPSCHHR